MSVLFDLTFCSPMIYVFPWRGLRNIWTLKSWGTHLYGPFLMDKTQRREFRCEIL